jgi:hypothetical protein
LSLIVRYEKAAVHLAWAQTSSQHSPLWDIDLPRVWSGCSPKQAHRSTTLNFSIEQTRRHFAAPTLTFYAPRWRAVALRLKAKVRTSDIAATALEASAVLDRRMRLLGEDTSVPTRGKSVVVFMEAEVVEGNMRLRVVGSVW